MKSRIKLFWVLIFIFAPFFAVYSQVSSDSLHWKLKQFEEDSLKRNYLFQSLRKVLFQNPQEAQYYAIAFDSLAQKRGILADEAMGKNFIAISNHLIGKYDEALSFYLKALPLFEAVKDTYYVAMVNNNIGVVYKESGEWDKTLEYYQRALKLFEETENTLWTANMLNNIGTFYWDKKDTLARKYFREAIDKFTELSNSTYLISAYNNLGNTYEDLEDTRIRISYYERAISFPESLNPEGHLMTQINLADAYRIMGQKGKSKELFVAAQDSEYFPRFIQRQRQWEKAYSDFLSTQGNFQLALDHYKKYELLKDSIYNTERDQQMKELLTRYETEKKEKSLQEQQVVLLKTTQERNLWVGISSILLILGSFVGLFIWQRNRNKLKVADLNAQVQAQQIKQLEQEKQLVSTQKLIEGQIQERKRMARDLHDGLGGLLAGVKSHFHASNQDPEKKQQILDKTAGLIDQSYEELRRISHDLMPINLVDSNLTYAMEELVKPLKEKGVKVDLELDEEVDKLEDYIALGVFRVIQEALHNIQKHAQADEVFVQLLKDDSNLRLMVEDDGIGFDTREVNSQNGMGLGNLRMRIEELQGKYIFESTPGEGTAIHAEIPI